jgi:thioredoxin reductase (NADPH)
MASSRTGASCGCDDQPAVDGRPQRPLPLESSIPGVFAIGDARAGSIKRAGAAIGEGAAAVA